MRPVVFKVKKVECFDFFMNLFNVGHNAKAKAAYIYLLI